MKRALSVIATQHRHWFDHNAECCHCGKYKHIPQKYIKQSPGYFTTYKHFTKQYLCLCDFCQILLSLKYMYLYITCIYFFFLCWRLAQFTAVLPSAAKWTWYIKHAVNYVTARTVHISFYLYLIDQFFCTCHRSGDVLLKFSNKDTVRVAAVVFLQLGYLLLMPMHRTVDNRITGELRELHLSSFIGCSHWADLVNPLVLRVVVHYQLLNEAVKSLDLIAVW